MPLFRARFWFSAGLGTGSGFRLFGEGLVNLEIARDAEAAELSLFFKKFQSSGPVEVRVDRRGDFFLPYRMQGDDFRTYVLRDAGETLGVVTFVLQTLWLHGRPTRVAFARDLRIAQNRKAILGWTQHFLPVLEQVRRELGAEHFFSSINKHELSAMNAFVRPRAVKRPFPRYFLFRRFNLISLHGRFPWAPKPLTSLRIRRGSKNIEDALIAYIVRKSREKDLARAWSAEELQRQLGRWKNLRLEDFYAALDARDNIVGCTASWSAGGLEDFVPMAENMNGANFRQFLKFGQFFGWTRTLTKPASRLGMEGTLDFRYLSFLWADHADVFESLAAAAYDEARPNEFLVYLQMRSDLHLRRPWTWVSAKIPSSLYCLVDPEQEPPDFLHPANDRSADLDPFFV